MRQPAKLTRVLEKLHLKKPTPLVTPEQAKKAVPVRHPMIKWELNDDELIVITIPRRNDLKVRLLSILFPMPEKRTIVLDEVGTEVWHMCDGSCTVSEMVARFARKYKLNKREAEVSLKEFLNTLIKRRYIGLQMDKETARELVARTEKPSEGEQEKGTGRRRRRRRSKKRSARSG